MTKVKNPEGKPVFGFQSRVIKVEHPYLKNDKGEPVLLFEAHVRIINLNKTFVKAIRNVQIKYDLRESD